jgi:hypothetical protein
MVTRTARVRALESEFLAALARVDGIRIGPCGQRILLRRWASAVTTPVRFDHSGSAAQNLLQVVLWVPLGYPALLLERRLVKYIAVTAADGRAGLLLHREHDKPGWCWQISSFWAWPTGQGHGLPVIAAVLSAADVTGTALRLRAGNRRLAQDYYLQLGFDYREGQHGAVRPWMLRSATGHVRQASAPMIGVG